MWFMTSYLRTFSCFDQTIIGHVTFVFYTTN